MLLFSPYRVLVILGLNNKFTVPLCYYFFKVGLCVLKNKTNKVVHKLQPWSWSWESCQGWSSLYPFQNLFYVFLLVMRICQCSKWKSGLIFFFCPLIINFFYSVCTLWFPYKTDQSWKDGSLIESVYCSCRGFWVYFPELKPRKS